MDTETAIRTQIEPKLVEALGQLGANALLTRATLSYVTTLGNESKRYAAFVRTICADEHLIEVWGPERVLWQEKDWQMLSSSLS